MSEEILAKEMEHNPLIRVERLYRNRDQRVKELKRQDKKVIGYLCAHSPVEIMTAAGLIPYRIMGNAHEPITQADAYLETHTCGFIRSCFDVALKGGYDFLDGFVAPHSCETVDAMHVIWIDQFKPSYSHFIQVPHMAGPSSIQFLREELAIFKKSLEEFRGASISDHELREAIRAHNEGRRLVKGLYELRKQDPPPISGSELTQLFVALMSIPAEEGNNLLRDVLREVKQHRSGTGEKKPRLLIYGSEIDDVTFIKLVEECGANVVMDDLCPGSRHFWHEVELTPDLLSGIAARYLEKVRCPRTFRQGRPAERFSYLLDYATHFNVNGIILYSIKHCVPQEFDAPQIGTYLRAKGFPVLRLEDDYTASSTARLKTRIQAFVEMIESAKTALREE